MLITTTAYITASGGIRLATKSGKPRKGELTVTLELNVPDEAFQPPALVLRAGVAQSRVSTVPAAPLATRSVSIASKNGDTPPVDDVWTAERLRRVMALTGIDSEDLARRIGVTLSTVRAWQQAPKPFSPSLAARAELAELEAQASGVTG